MLLPSGIQPLFHNRIGWAHDRLKRAGLSESPRRGVWQLTEASQKFAAEHPNGFSEAEQYKLSYLNCRRTVFSDAPTCIASRLEAHP